MYHFQSRHSILSPQEFCDFLPFLCGFIVLQVFYGIFQKKKSFTRLHSSRMHTARLLSSGAYFRGGGVGGGVHTSRGCNHLQPRWMHPSPDAPPPLNAPPGFTPCMHRFPRIPPPGCTPPWMHPPVDR